MNFDHYQSMAMTTAIYPRIGANIIYPIIGLAEELGELDDALHDLLEGTVNQADTERLIENVVKEAGDVPWYVAACCYESSIPMSSLISSEWRPSPRMFMQTITKANGIAKRIIRDDNGILTMERREDVRKLLVDALHIASHALLLVNSGLTLAMEANIEKLAKRAQNGTLHGSGNNR